MNPALEEYPARRTITRGGDADCHFHIFVGPWSKFTDCDQAKDFLTKQGLSFKSTAAAREARGDDDRRQELKGGCDEAKAAAPR